jgi:hypothetical protein
MRELGLTVHKFAASVNASTHAIGLCIVSSVQRSYTVSYVHTYTCRACINIYTVLTYIQKSLVISESVA